MKKLAIAFFAACAAINASAQTIQPPTMGWSSWNTYHALISEDLIKSQADAAIDKGFAAAGYNSINIDDGFQNNRDAEGKLIIDSERFPNGLRPLVDYIHAKGLKAGTYSDAGIKTCASMYAEENGGKTAGLYGHDRQDLEMFFREMDFDFIKVDYCGAGDMGLDHKARYTEIANAIKAAAPDGKRIAFNVCCWNYPGTWVHDIADSWRTTEDIISTWNGYGGVKGIIAQNLYLSAYCYDGHYNDMDMLEVGVTRDGTMNADETFTHFAMWCIMSSPLLIGADMTAISDADRDLLCNAELIAVNQDALGLQAYVVKSSNGTYVLTKDVETLHGSKRAVAFYNPTDAAKDMSITMRELDLSGNVAVRDLGAKEDKGTFTGKYEVNVPAHGTRIYTFDAEKRLVRRLYEGETAWLGEYQEISNNEALGIASYYANSNCSGGMYVGWLGGSATNDLQWRNVYVIDEADYEVTLKICSGENRTINISVNGGEPVALNCNSGGWSAWSEVTTTLHLNAGNNIVRLYNAAGPMPDVDCMRIKVDDEAEPEPEPEPTDPYAVSSTAEGNNDASYGRKTEQIKLTVNGETQVIYTGQTTNNAAVYYDLTASQKFTCQVGDILTPSTSYNGTWMHQYVYVDEDGKGFSYGVDPTTHTPEEGSDLKSYSYLGGYDSNGKGGISSQYGTTLPSFNAPATAGSYRMRYKVDWDSADPAGSTDVNKGGIICDVMLEVQGEPNSVSTTSSNTTPSPAYRLQGTKATNRHGLTIQDGKKHLSK